MTENMKVKTHLDFFSGIGGFALAARWAGYETVGFCEIEPFCQKILTKHWPNVPIHGDIKQLTSVSVFDTTLICRELEAINTSWQEGCTKVGYLSENLVHSTGSQGKLCTGYSSVEELYSVLKSDQAKRITSLEDQGQIKLPKILLSMLSEKVLYSAKKLAKTAEEEAILKTEEEVYKRTTPTITSLLKLCGYARDVTMSGTNTTKQSKNYEERKLKIDLLTAGVPCQASSVAGKRKGFSDDRWLWPEAVRVIREIKPTWCILENVSGFLTIEQGLGFERTVTDLEAEGYEVQPFVIPACAVNAPHRRDRVWIVGHSRCESEGDKIKRFDSERIDCSAEIIGSKEGGRFTDKDCDVADTCSERRETDAVASNSDSLRVEGEGTEQQATRTGGSSQDAPYANSKHGKESIGGNQLGHEGKESPLGRCVYEPLWETNWIEAATAFCRMDDGLSDRVDRIKALGNAIVPQVAYEIIRSLA